MRKAMVLGVLGLAGTLASPAFADEFSGFRLGANISSESMDSDLFYAPFNATESNNNNRFAYGLSGGWGLNRYLAFELGLRGGSEFNSDHFEDRMTANPENYISAHTELWGLEASVVGSVWIGKVSFFARAGMFGWQADQMLSVGNVATDVRPAAKVVTTVEDDGFNPLFGVGMQTALDGALVRLEYRQSELEDLAAAGVFSVTDIKLESLDFSIVWIF